MRFDPKKEKKITPFKITQNFKANIGKPFPIIFLLSFPIVWIRKTGKRCFLAPAKWLNALHISMSFNNRFSMGIWDRRLENICPFPGSQTQVLTVCVVCETYQPKQRDRHTSILHGFNNQTPWWPLTQELVENGITWPILDSTHLFQLLTLDFPSFPSYLKCGKGPLSAVLICYPPRGWSSLADRG